MTKNKKTGMEAVTIKTTGRWPIEDIISLYKAAGWWGSSEPQTVRGIIRGSIAFAVAVSKKSGKAVGMGRAISDGVSDAYIQDVIVLPEYRGRGIGKKIIETLVKKCIKKNIGWIALVAEPGSEEFYRGLGFERMEGHVPMKYAGRRK